MKLKYGYVLREIADSYVVVPVGNGVADFEGIITLNEVGAFLWENLKQDTDEAALLKALTNEYYVDEATAKADIAAFVAKAKENALLDD